MKTPTQRISTHLFLILLGIASMATTQAQEVQVDSADPSSAEQGTIALEIVISGSGFNSVATVDFFVPDSLVPSGINVKKFKTRGPKKIIATIDVSETAEVADYDIEVTLSNGRKGKGTTTLFSVHEKTTGIPVEEIYLHFEPLNGVNSAGLLTRHDVIWIHDYSVRNDAAGCPSELNDKIWTIRSERTTPPGGGDVVYNADDNNLVIDVLAAGVGFDGCYGPTSVSTGAFELRKQKVGKGKKNTNCNGRIVWTFGHLNTANGIEYFTLQSTGPEGDGWIPLMGPPGSDLSGSELCETDSSLVLDGTFEFTRTNDSGTELLGQIGLAFFVVFHYPCCLPEG